MQHENERPQHILSTRFQARKASSQKEASTNELMFINKTHIGTFAFQSVHSTEAGLKELLSFAVSTRFLIHDIKSGVKNRTWDDIVKHLHSALLLGWIWCLLLVTVSPVGQHLRRECLLDAQRVQQVLCWEAML